MPYAHAVCERTRRGARHVAGPRVRFTARRSRLASFTTRRTRSPATLARCRRVAWLHMRIARARNQAGRAKRSNGKAIAAHRAQKSRVTREIRRRGPPDPPIPRPPPSAWESHSLTTYRVFHTTSEKHRVSCHSASLRPAVLSTEHEGVLDGFRFRYEKRYGYDADAHARGRKPRWRPAIGASGSPRTGSYRRTCQGLRP